MTPLMIRMWINQPSTLQPFNKYHGENVLVDGRQEGKYVSIYFTKGDKVGCTVPRNVLAKGWK